MVGRRGLQVFVDDHAAPRQRPFRHDLNARVFQAHALEERLAARADQHDIHFDGDGFAVRALNGDDFAARFVRHVRHFVARSGY